MSTDTTRDHENNSENVRVLWTFLHIRERPSMYIGSTDTRGLHSLVFEIVNKSIDDWLAGSCKRIAVELLRDGGCRVYDDGSGIPTDYDSRIGMRYVEGVMKYVGCPSRQVGNDRTEGGLRGVGLVATNALSARLHLRIARAGVIWEQEYRQGEPVTPLQPVGDAVESGTSITFWPDPEIFQETTEFEWDMLANRLRELAYLYPGIEILLLDHRNLNEVYDVFLTPRGAEDFLAECNRGSQATHSVIRIQSGHSSRARKKPMLDAAIQWIEEDGAKIRSYANGADTMFGGSHLVGFREGVVRAVRRYGRLQGIAEIKSLTPDDIRNGLTGIVAVRLLEPCYSGPTKAQLYNPDAQPWVQREVNKQLFAYLKSHPAEAKLILDRILRSRRQRSQ